MRREITPMAADRYFNMIVQFIPVRTIAPELHSSWIYNSIQSAIDIGIFRLNVHDSHDQREGSVFIPAMSGDDTVFSKVQIVHRLIDNLFDPFPVAAPLYELVNVLP